MAVAEKISKLVKNQFPDFYKEEGEKFLAFIEAYYEYMEENGKLTDAIRNLQSYRDVSTTTDEYIKYFQRTFLPSVPEEVLADKKLMIKYIKNFNASRGTLASYKLLFRAIYNEDVDFIYPGDQILKVSEGDWRMDRYLVTSYSPATYAFIGKTIKGIESTAEALVEDIVRRSIRGRDVMQILVSNIKGSFNNLEPVRLLEDVNATGHTPFIEAGINRVEIQQAGGKYEVGDVVTLYSDDVGDFGKIVVTETVDLGGAISFAITDGGSGYTSSIEQGGTKINIIGGDGLEKSSFEILQNDINDTFSIYININLIASNTIFGSAAPTVSAANGSPLKMYNFANTIIGATSYGFRETEDEPGNQNYHDHANAVLVVANTSSPGIANGASLFGVTSQANATVSIVRRSYNGTNIVLGVDAYKNFTVGEKINIATSSGVTVGTVSSFTANTAGWHPVWVAVISGRELSVGDEVRGRTSGAIGVVRHVGAANTGAYTAPSSATRDVYVYRIGANTSANVSSQFQTGPIKSFIANEPIALVTANTTVGNVVYTSANTTVENVHTKLQDSFIFKSTVFGTIAKLSRVTGGSGHSIAPKVSVRENDVSSLGIGEQYITMVSANSELHDIDSSDRLIQSPASGDVKEIVSRTRLANTFYQVVARVWQPFNQRDPGNIYFANNTTATLQRIEGDYTPGYQADTRTVANTMPVTIIGINDRGVLGKNAVITPTIGSDGTIAGIRVIDSGFSYRQNENVRFEQPNRPASISATGNIFLSGVANSEGYYATTRSQISTARGYIQDSYYYQEFSYEIISPVAIKRWRDFALKLCHPAGEALFGKYRVQSNTYVTVTANTIHSKTLPCNGTISISKNSSTITGSGTTFTREFSNNGLITIEYAPGEFYKLPLNIVSSDTSANVKISWSNNTITGASAYYNSGSF